MDRAAGWVLVLAWVVPLLFNDAMLNVAFLNITLILIYLFTFCGLSFVDFKFSGVIKIAGVRYLIYLIGIVLNALLLDLLATGLVIIGLADSVLDLRVKRIWTGRR